MKKQLSANIEIIGKLPVQTYGLHSYLAAAMPQEVFNAGKEHFAEKCSSFHGEGKLLSGDENYGDWLVLWDDDSGIAGLPGTKYLLYYTYEEQAGTMIQNAYYAIEVKINQ